MINVPRRRRFAAALPLGAALLLAACGGGGGSDATTTTASTVAVTTTTVKPSTTLAATTAAPTTTAPATTTTVAPAPTWPLTGLPITDPTDLTPLRRAAVVKIENTPPAVPQAGLSQADIVYEENVEGVTRFAAVFHSQTADPVGPIRSGRTQDVNLLESLNHPLFLWSGGNGPVTEAINGSELEPFNETRSKPLGISFRVSSRSAPHNLYGHLDKLWENAPEGLFPPPPQFSYATAATAAAPQPEATPATQADLRMEGGLDVSWTYDPASGRWFRSQRGKPHDDADGVQISAENVVILGVDYQPSPKTPSSPEAQTTGSGEAWVLVDGTLRHGTWNRADEHSPWILTGNNGATITLNPGNTWVELAHAETPPTVS
jgi:hypothetical protein